MPEDVDWVVTLKVDSDGSVHRVCGAANQISDKRFQHNKESSPQANSSAALNAEQQLLVIACYISHLGGKDSRDSMRTLVRIGKGIHF